MDIDYDMIPEGDELMNALMTWTFLKQLSQVLLVLSVVICLMKGKKRAREVLWGDSQERGY